jgi:alanine racemase
VVKADGYGHGLVAAARAALRGGGAALVVATLDEALTLRDSGIEDRIIVQYPVPPAMLGVAIEAGLDLVVADEESVRALAGWLGSTVAPRVHLGIDTGLSRGGLSPDDGVAAARRLLDTGLPGLAGPWSHLATPGDPAAVASQVARFEAMLADLRTVGIDPGLRHLDATGGLLAGTSPAYDLVRVGLAFYGIVPPDAPVAPRMAAVAGGVRPALSLRARATTITAIETGAAVGYGGTWTATRPSVIATLPLGYADGWARAYATDGWGVARGRRVPIVGRVSSDAVALDVTDVPGFGASDEVALLGGEGAMTVHDLAARRGSISWEVMDALAPRLPRVYTERGVPVGFRYLDGRTHIPS